ncbi:hypothetical protein ACFC0D_19415 [Streptomyces sp. NPDC056222]|uniref:hypothetical protein n=1 Tax=Streptomyces sp. NPDC056222 TaxID=3345749 RepID=UPI0035D710A2
MTETYDLYRDAMSDPWRGWWVTWPLSRQVRLGSVYDVQDGAVRTAGSLAKRGISLARERGAPPAAFTYDSNGAVTVRFKAAGSSPDGFAALAVADAGALVEFQRNNATLVVYQGLSQLGTADVKSLAGELVNQWWNGSWTATMLAVTEVVSATSGTVLSAAGSGAAAELKLSATAGPGGPAALGDVALGASVMRSNALGIKWTGSDVTPFYHVIKLKESWWGRVSADYGPRQPGRGAQPGKVPPVLVEEAQDDPHAVLMIASTDDQAPIETVHDDRDEAREA